MDRTKSVLLAATLLLAPALQGGAEVAAPMPPQVSVTAFGPTVTLDAAHAKAHFRVVAQLDGSGIQDSGQLTLSLRPTATTASDETPAVLLADLRSVQGETCRTPGFAFRAVGETTERSAVLPLAFERCASATCESVLDVFLDLRSGAARLDWSAAATLFSGDASRKLTVRFEEVAP